MRKYYKKLRYILEYILFEIFITFLKILGFKNSVAFCAFVARKIGPRLKVSQVARKNLYKIFGPNINKEVMIEQIWDNFGKYIGEFPFINALSDEDMNTRLVIEGRENIADFKMNNKPFLLFLSHQANWDFVIRHITSIYPKFAIVYRKVNNPYIDKEILQTRGKSEDILMIAKGPSGAKELIKAIKKGYAICMLVDQKMNDGIEVPFLGYPAMTANAIAKLSLQYGYPIIPCQLTRLNDSYFKAVLYPQVKYTPSQNKEQEIYNIMLVINQTIEKWIIESPTQWFWFHNRWKE